MSEVISKLPFINISISIIQYSLTMFFVFHPVPDISVTIVILINTISWSIIWFITSYVTSIMKSYLTRLKLVVEQHSFKFGIEVKTILPCSSWLHFNFPFIILVRRVINFTCSIRHNSTRELPFTTVVFCFEFSLPIRLIFFPFSTIFYFTIEIVSMAFPHSVDPASLINRLEMIIINHRTSSMFRWV